MTRTLSTIALVATALAAAGSALCADAGPGDRDAGPVAELPDVAAHGAIAEDAGPPAAVEPPTPTIPADRMPTLSLSVEPREAAVGDLITWKAQIRRRVGDRVHLSRAADFGDLEIQGKDDDVSEPVDDWITETLTVRLIAFDPGEHEIPAQTVTVVDIDGNMAVLVADPVPVKIESLIANEPEPALKPDTGPGVPVLEEDYTLLYVLAVIGGIIAVALLTLLGRKLWSMRGPRPEPPPPPPRPAEEIALEKLNALQAAGLLDAGEHKAFHVALSETFREYLGNRYRFHSLDRSTEELVAEIRRLALDQVLFSRVRDLLEDTDLVKFAKFVPDVVSSGSMLAEAFAIVAATTPSQIAAQPARPAPAPEGGQPGGRDA